MIFMTFGAMVTSSIAQDMQRQEVAAYDERVRREVWRVPDSFRGTTDDWINIQSMIRPVANQWIAGTLKAAHKLANTPNGARRNHRRSLKRKRR